MNLNRIINIDVKEGDTFIYSLNLDGSTSLARRPFRYFLLAQKPLDDSWISLQGSNPYKYMKFYDTKKQFWWDYRRIKNPFAVFQEIDSVRILSGLAYYGELELGEIPVLSFDLETNGIAKNEDSKILLISNTFQKDGRTTRKLFAYDEFETQAQMLASWCQWVRQQNPVVLMGHNIYGFDIPYLLHVGKLHDAPLRLGRDGSALCVEGYVSQFRKDGSQSLSYHCPRVFGRDVIDTLFLAIKYDTGRKYESYALKSIVKQEGLERRDRAHYDASQISLLYKDEVEWAKIKRYAEHDADDALALFNLMAQPYFYLTRLVPKSFQEIINRATGSQINCILIQKYLMSGHSIPVASEPVEYVGAISIGNPGVYKNVFKVDVASLYPSIIEEFQVQDPKKDPRGEFLKMVAQMTRKRLEYKAQYQVTQKEEFKALSDAGKILCNSAYGFLGAPGLHFNSPLLASLVTKTGREILTQAIDWCHGRGFTLVNADTDSIAFCKSGQSAMTDAERTSLLAELNALYPARIHWEDDGYYDAVLVVKAKNYALQSGSKITIKGSALKATHKEQALRECIFRIIQALLSGDKNLVHKLKQEYLDEIENISDINRWASKKTITAKVLNPKRTNESKVLQALEGTHFQEGDKRYFYFAQDQSLKLSSAWVQDHCKKRLKGKLKATLKVFGKEYV